jgi:hypothetical protein
MIVQSICLTNVTVNGNVDVAALRSKRRIRRMSQNQKPLNSTEKRLAFYANLLQDGKLKLTDEEAEEWRRLLPLAIEAQHFLISMGELPVQMTIQNVRRLAEFEKRRDKTLDN